MEWIANLLRAFFEETEIAPERINEIEIVPSGLPWAWYLHVQPAQPWFAEVNCCAGDYGVTLHDYLV